MGWKAASIFVNERGPGYFGTLPPHNPEKARKICHSLGLSFSNTKQSTFENGLYPPAGTFALGAYEGGLILADQDELIGCSGEDDDPTVLKILHQYPDASILCITLHSVVNHWGYALYENSKLLRRFVGDADDGIALEEGQLQPEEKTLFERSRQTEPGRRIFQIDINGVTEEFPENAAGEELVFRMASRFFGQPLDHCKPVDLFDLQLELFSKPQKATSSFKSSAKPLWKFW